MAPQYIQTEAMKGLKDDSQDPPTDPESRAEMFDSSSSVDGSSVSGFGDRYDDRSHSSPGGRDDHSGGGESEDRSDDDLNTKVDIAVICWSRWSFILLLSCSTFVLAGFVIATMRETETDNFENKFLLMSDEFILTSTARLENDFRTLLGLSNTVTGFQAFEQSDGPLDVDNETGFVTVPDVDHHFGVAMESMDASIVGYLPRIVKSNHQAWLDYSAANQDWILDANSASSGLNPIPSYIWESDDTPVPVGTRSKMSPIWQFVPPPPVAGTDAVNFNMMSVSTYQVGREFISRTLVGTLLATQNFSKYFGRDVSGESPEAAILQPVLTSLDDNSTMSGDLMAVIPWTALFQNMFASTSSPLHVVISNTCDQAMTFLVDGPNATYVGEGDLHDPKYNYIGEEAVFAGFANSHDLLPVEYNESNHCEYYQTLYPTSQFEENEQTMQPFFMAIAIIAVAIFIVVGFVAFDYMVTKRQKELMKTARKQHAIVSSLFPRAIQKQLMAEVEQDPKFGKGKLSNLGKAGLRNYLNEEDRVNEVTDSKPIADLFPETTIMFADIVGFTAWSSQREPSQVFVLLETIYREFDSIAKRHRVFKVEVVGDCYVAVCGLPDPRPNHAITMAKFARDCVTSMKKTAQELEVELGPDTTELGIRVGLHSGPVVAGVLRGEKSRFQLFGDTMNTASRMETTGLCDQIQVSQETAELLVAAGRSDWLTPREAKIEAKGKGELQTYWLSAPAQHEFDSGNSARTGGSSEEFDSPVAPKESAEKINRVAEWTVEVLAKLLKQMVAGREARSVQPDPRSKIEEMELSYTANKGSKNVIDEVAEYVVLPNYKQCQKIIKSAAEIDLGDKVMSELRSYVQMIASLYNENSFHNFDHANHVVMSVNKLLSRIVAPDLDDVTEQNLHDHTYGINSDPLTQFACVFSALIHDVDHSGAPNAQLVKEGAPVAALYQGKSVAEQNSFDLAWELLSEPSYKNLREVIYVTVGELRRFRQLVVNSVMATDIVDKDLKQLRNNRWDAVFSDSESCPKDENGVCINSRRTTILKATIVIEHLIQASDVAHTMQHWHVYRRWNEKFFIECYQAYLDGRADTDPSENWYKGEIGFFDFYIIPLAKKLKDCGVFGVSSDEYLAYATQNRKEWKERGEDLVREMIQEVKSKQSSRRASQRPLLR